LICFVNCVYGIKQPLIKSCTFITAMRPENGCHVHEFQCGARGGCIPDTWKCDGQSDCEDASDETRCSKWMEHTFNLCCLLVVFIHIIQGFNTLFTKGHPRQSVA